MSAKSPSTSTTSKRKHLKLNRKDFLKVKQLFDELDTDKNGSLDSSEFAVFVRMMGIMVAHDNMDRNNDGRIDFKEMLQFVYPGASPSAIQSFLREQAGESKDSRSTPSVVLLKSQLDEIKQLFELHSRGGRTISREALIEVQSSPRSNRSSSMFLVAAHDLMQAMVFPGGYTEEEVVKILEEFDADGDGELSLEEYTEMMKIAYKICNKCMCTRAESSGTCKECRSFGTQDNVVTTIPATS
ncbi:hypothetical protein GUITHDRAFT_116172 [Guillardia theta CCMP2712]|uniref:EF-hand domain-containing protein n=1 Tax=Guillardia theta (strain CCMP2712) TaxID=905079 RepID=L1IN33_GUITC|nr:hypothetical protein GUITHDRAFT_116172 [Guillardia theta CCMP2712]EKX37696.1 hypothetical protein GUITHDRAFT_116172 [Guillardia theta CCMP2712]|eukprot:XP_005824676.1 hypothetical protein GUITHDRAFT_116172 [Guillardia theta CCMP2712]